MINSFYMKFKNKSKGSLVVFFCLFLCSTGQAQSPSDRQNYLPQIVTKSPETAMMERFGNYSVNLFNGVPDISIPLYEINTGKLKVPVVLSYHASGVKVREDAGLVGLGWSLSAGGAISRTVRSKADEQAGYLNGTTYIIAAPGNLDPRTSNADLNYANQVARGVYDVEPDIYSCNLPGLNCKFYYGNRSVLQPVLIPFSAAKLTTTLTGNSLNFDMLEEGGTEFKLGTVKETYTSAINSDSYPTAWNLSQMISNDKTDTIYFNYVDNSYSGGGGDYYDLTTVTDFVTNTQDVASCSFPANCATCQGNIVTTQGGGLSSGIGSNALQEIKFPQGKVVFELDASNRLDIPNKSLKTVKIYSLNPVTGLYSLLKTYAFTYGYFVNGTERRLKLASLQLKDNSDVNIQTYSFNYNEAITMPLKNSRSRDYWGYFNNAVNNSLIPKQDITVLGPNGGATSTTVTIGGALNGREPAPAYNQVGTLTKITYPTGGTTEFFYETNQYYDNATSSIKYGGGLRIQQIKNTDPISGNINYKTYKYGATGLGDGNIIIPVNLSYFSTTQVFYAYFDVFDVTRRIRNFSSNPNVGLDPFDGSSVGYSTVTEFLGTEAANSGKSVYKYNFVADNYGYDIVQFSKPSITSRCFERGWLLSKTDFKKNPDGSFRMAQSVDNLYGAWPNTYSIDAINLRLFESTTYKSQSFAGGSCGSTSSGAQPYTFGSYQIINGDNRITSSIQKVYNELDDSKFVATSTIYAYNNFTYKQLSKTTTTNSKNETVETNYTYSYDFPAQTAPASMIAANMINKIIDKNVTLNSVQISSVHTEYGSFGTNHNYPSYISTALKAASPVTEVTFNGYDNNGNITNYTGRDAIATSFIWDYKSRLPIAKISGTSSSNCAYSSFEADGTGGWTFTGKIQLDPTAPTGRMAYNLASGNITKTVLAGNYYTVSYWRPTTLSALIITGTQAGYPVTGRTVNGWKYYEHKITGVTSVSLSGTGLIDELRLYPTLPTANVQMSTFTYDPLVGTTAQCDANNRINYYEYDGLQRLVLVRDQDKNILKRVCYNYAGEIENCNIFYNSPQSATYFKTGCTGCLAGSAVTYTVPANTYSASSQPAADLLAMNDATTNGQAYANANGTCVTPANATVTGSNANNQTQSFRFHNNCTGTDYNFSMNANTALTSLGSVPVGNYNVVFNPPVGTGQYTYKVGSLTLRANNGTISNVDVAAGGVIVNITP
jgi:hypothetical protein